MNDVILTDKVEKRRPELGRWGWLLLGASAALFAQTPAPSPNEIMLATVSRDTSMLSGGLSSSRWTGRGTVVVEPLVRLTATGKWKEIPCDPYTPKDCRKFAREYLSKPHTYTVISADGKGATIRAAPTKLSECFDYSGTGTYSAPPIARSAVAASSPEWFEDSPPLQAVSAEQGRAIRKALAAFIPKRLDSTTGIRLLAMRLGARDLLILERAFVQTATSRLKFVFAIGTWDQSRLRILRWQQDDEDREERVLGTIALKGGHQFLVTVVNDPESHSYRIYGFQDGSLRLVYSGGGSSC